MAQQLSNDTNTSYSRRLWNIWKAFGHFNSRALKYMTRMSGLNQTDNCVPTRVDGTEIYYFDSKIISMEGATSIVYEGFFNSEARPAAVKRLRPGPESSGYKNELTVWTEITKCLTPESANIVQLFAWKEIAENGCYFSMELGKTDLYKRVQELKAQPLELSHDNRVGFLKDAATGLKFLHCRDRPIIHRDIKPQNIIIFLIPDGGGREIAKLSDFGISRILNSSATGTNTRGMGTSDWMSPEAIEAMCNNDQVFQNTTSMDIFSFGMTCYFTMSCGEHPFRGGVIPENIRNQRKHHAMLDGLWLLTANHLFDWMMMKFENQQGKRRPAIQEVLHHPFFYSPEKSLSLITGFANALASKHKQSSAEEIVRRAFNRRYVNFISTGKFEDLLPSVNSASQGFDWKEILGDDAYNFMISRRTSDIKNNYNVSSMMSLIQLIRDKFQHYQDQNEGLIQDKYFWEENAHEQWTFSEEKYACFFLRLFPELVLALFVFVVQRADSSLATLRRQHDFSLFGQVPNCRLGPQGLTEILQRSNPRAVSSVGSTTPQ